MCLDRHVYQDQVRILLVNLKQKNLDYYSKVKVRFQSSCSVMPLICMGQSEGER